MGVWTQEELQQQRERLAAEAADVIACRRRAQQEHDAWSRLADLLEMQARIFAALTQAAELQTQATTALMQALVRVMDEGRVDAAPGDGEEA